MQSINSYYAILDARESFSGQSEVCPHVPNRAGFFVPIRRTRECKTLVASMLLVHTVALLIVLMRLCKKC
jgi:hypothetical protein